MDNHLVGQTIQNRYHIIEKIGRGNSGITFVAEDRESFNDLCVVKQFKPRSHKPQELEIAKRLFKTEAEILSKLGSHDRIPSLFAHFVAKQDFFIVQELIKGQDLSKELAQRSYFPQEDILDLLEDVLEILVFVQKSGVIHRDIKPSNLIRRDLDGKIVLIDFGSVKQVSPSEDEDEDKKPPTIIVGTKNYVPLEQVMGNPGFYSDIYSLGIVAVQALTGKLSSELATTNQGKILWQDDLREENKYSPKLLKIIDKAIRQDHQERYQSAQEVLTDVSELKSSLSNKSPKGTVSKSSRKSSRSRSKKSKNRNKLILFSLLSLLVIALLRVIPKPWRSPKPQLPQFAQFLSYQDQDYDLEINYPEDWQQQQINDFLIPGVIFISPLEDEQDLFQENVSISIESLLEESSLQTYTAESVAEIKRIDPFVPPPEKTYLGKHESRKITYESKNRRGLEVTRTQIWTVSEGKAYILTYTAEPEQYQNFMPIVERMIESFKLSIPNG